MVKTRSRLSGTARTVLNKRRSDDNLKVSGKKMEISPISKKKSNRNINNETSVDTSEDVPKIKSLVRSSKNIRKRDRTQIRDETNSKPERRTSKRIKVLDVKEQDLVTKNSDKIPKEKSPKSQNQNNKSSINSGSIKNSTKKVSNHISPKSEVSHNSDSKKPTSETSRYPHNKKSSRNQSPRKETSGVHTRSSKKKPNPRSRSMPFRRNKPTSGQVRTNGTPNSRHVKDAGSRQDRTVGDAGFRQARTSSRHVGNLPASRHVRDTGASHHQDVPRRARMDVHSQERDGPTMTGMIRGGHGGMIRGHGGMVRGRLQHIPRIPRHRCTRSCPVGCQGHLRPNEIIIYESFKFEKRLLGGDRYVGRIVSGHPRERQVGCTPRVAGSGSTLRGSSRLLQGSTGRVDGSTPRETGSTHRVAGSTRRMEGSTSCMAGSTGCHVPHGERTFQRTFGRGHASRANPGAGIDLEVDGRGLPALGLATNDEVRRVTGAPMTMTTPPPSLYKGLPNIEMPVNIEMLLSLSPAPLSVQLEHTWNPEDKSRNIYLKEDDPRIFQRYPVAQSTDAARAKIGFSSGVHAWEVSWPVGHRGTHAVVGVANASAPLYAPGYQSLVGIDAESWGWDLGRGKAYHDSKKMPGFTYPRMKAVYRVPGRIVMILDMDRGELSFLVGGRWLGVAHGGLKGRKLFPVASSVWGHCEIGLAYLGGMEPRVMSLMDLCRRQVRRSLGPERVDKGEMENLNLPTIITHYLERRK